MKRLFSLLCIGLLIFTLVACGGETKDIFDKSGDAEVDKGVTFNVVTDDDLPEELHDWSGHQVKTKKEYQKVNDFLYVIIASGRKATGGYEVIIDDVVRQDDDVYVYFAEIGPTADMGVTEAITYPKKIVKIETELENIVFKEIEVKDKNNEGLPSQDPNTPVSNETSEMKDGGYTPGETTTQLPSEIQIEVIVEGEKQIKHATLAKSTEQNYSIYLLDQYTLKAEEAGKDVLLSEYDEAFFVRIERVGSGMNPTEIKNNLIGSLLENVKYHDLDPDQFSDEYFHEAEFYLLVESEDEGSGSTNLIHMVKKYGDEYVQFMFHFPLKEAMEGINPSFYAMLKTLSLH